MFFFIENFFEGWLLGSAAGKLFPMVVAIFVGSQPRRLEYK